VSLPPPYSGLGSTLASGVHDIVTRLSSLKESSRSNPAPVLLAIAKANRGSFGQIDLTNFLDFKDALAGSNRLWLTPHRATPLYCRTSAF
jgi:hypothetical protein